MTADTNMPRSRPVQRAPRRTSTVASKNVPRGHSDSWQKNGCLDQMTSTVPATGVSRIRCRLRECR
jgi:hypothetical protein